MSITKWVDGISLTLTEMDYCFHQRIMGLCLNSRAISAKLNYVHYQ